MKHQIWFITGASKGLGLSLVKRLLKLGYKVAATSRKHEDLEKAVGEPSENFIPLTMDLVNEDSVAKAIERAITHFGRIDVVVNNAGFGMAGALEELSDSEARANFDVNVFGTLNVIRKIMPYLRDQKSGHIFNFSSIGGFTGAFPGFGIYCATKFAVQGFTESLACEAKPFGINATVVSPGYFRTSFLSNDSLSVPKQEIPAYENVREIQLLHQNGLNGKQLGDPEKAAAVIISVAHEEQPPVHLFLGQDAYDLAEDKMNSLRKEMELVRQLATATAVDE